MMVKKVKEKEPIDIEIEEVFKKLESKRLDEGALDNLDEIIAIAEEKLIELDPTEQEYDYVRTNLDSLYKMRKEKSINYYDRDLKRAEMLLKLKQDKDTKSDKVFGVSKDVLFKAGVVIGQTVLILCFEDVKLISRNGFSLLNKSKI